MSAVYVLDGVNTQILLGETVMRTLAAIMGLSVAVAMMVADTPCVAQQQRTRSGQSNGLSTPRRPNRTRPIRPPTVSPYLNLFRPGASPGANYNTLVRPQLDQQARNRQQQAQLRTLTTNQQQIADFIAPFGAAVGAQQPRTTGHTTTFQNLGSYFGTR